MKSILICFMLLIGVSYGNSVTARVELVSSSCDFFVVELRNGDFVLIERLSGRMPNVGHTLYGNFRRAGGRRTITNRNASNEIVVRVEEDWLSRRNAIEMFNRRCLR